MASIKIGKNLAGIKTTLAPALSEQLSDAVVSDEETGQLDFAAAWQRLLNEVKFAKKDYLHAILLEHAPVLDDDNACSLQVLSDVQHHILEQEKGELLEKLRRWTGNFNIKFAYVFLKNDSDIVKPVTSVDKFSRMVEKNPHLLSMVEKFGLDIDY